MAPEGPQPADLNQQPAGAIGAPSEPDIHESGAARGRSAWWRLGLRLQAITPTTMARGLLRIGAVALIIWAVVASWPSLLPFVGGLLIAYLLLPVVNAMDHVLPRPLASLLAVIGFFLLVAGMLGAIFRPVVEQLGALFVSLPSAETVQQVLDRLTDHLSALPPPVAQGIHDTVNSSYQNFLSQQPLRRVLLIGVSAFSSLFNSLGFVLGLFVIPAWLLSVINDYGVGLRAVNRLLPEWMRGDARGVARIVDRSLKSFLRIQVTNFFAVAIIMYLAILVAQHQGWSQFRYPLVNALFPALMQFVPTFGVFLGAIPAVLHAIFVSPADGLLTLGIYLGALWLANLLFGQRWQRQILDMHNALLVLVLVVLSSFGPLWVLISAPVAAILRDLFRYAYGRLSDPPRPAGLLPGEPLPAPAGSSSRRNARVPLVYRRRRIQTETSETISSASRR